MSVESAKSVRVRIAPSPTGNCHVGTARNALYNLLFARQRGGAFILRIDDTDQRRSTLESERGVLEGLRWLDLAWDEGPDVGGAFGPYRQSERLGLYRDCAQTLVEQDTAYYCFCTAEELEQERQAARTEGGALKYSGRCRTLSRAEVQARLQAGQKPVVRLKIVPRLVEYLDLVQGRIAQDAALLGDPVILKSDGMPTYSFATVVDDHQMQISHVLRSGEHINNTFPQLQVYEALGWAPPEFGHFGLLLNPDRSKISKRSGAVYVGEFRTMGYLPEAIVNHLALSGWNPGNDQDVFSFQELLQAFSLDRCSRANAIFDYAKLAWLNGHYIRHTAVPDLTRRSVPFLVQAGLLPSEAVGAQELAHLEGIVGLEQERIELLSELPDKVSFFFQDPAPAVCVELLKTNKLAKKHTPAELGRALLAALQVLGAADAGQWRAARLIELLDGLVEAFGWKRAELLMSIRLAVSGREATPSLFETLEYVGKSATLRRLEAVVALLPAQDEAEYPIKG